MCQIRVVLEAKGEQETIMEDVTKLQITQEGIVVSSLFEDPKLVPGVKVKEIDFLNNTALVTNQAKIL